MEKRILTAHLAMVQISADKAFVDIRRIFLKHYQSALHEVGRYLLDNFFDGDIDRIRRPFRPVHEESYNQLVEMIQADSGSSPSKSWLYNALGLLVDEHDYRNFQTYGNLLPSVKVELLPIKDQDQKHALIIEASENDYSVRDVQARKRELKQQAKSGPKSDDRAGLFGTKEWAEININCCTGCSNDCRYCYAKSAAMRYKRISHSDEWLQMTIKDDAVLKRYKKLNGRVMFPTTHDITPENIYACLIVLDNLLRAGNEVLIVSKPRMDCITKICRYLKPYKKQIEFRFTIGAEDDEVLSYWEPNAPLLAERLNCLNHTLENGYKVSVSAEPMLDPENIGQLLEALPVEKLESVWIGKMNHINRIRANGDDELQGALDKLADAQSDDNILRIYDQWKTEPLIKWKESISEVVEKHQKN